MTKMILMELAKVAVVVLVLLSLRPHFHVLEWSLIGALLLLQFSICTLLSHVVPSRVPHRSPVAASE